MGSEEQVKSVRNFLKSKTNTDDEVTYIDFNNIVEMPDYLLIELNTAGILAQFIYFGTRGLYSPDTKEEALKSFESYTEKEQTRGVELALEYEENCKKTGHSTWHSWRKQNWGTKWNAYNQYVVDENVLIFKTAWEGVPDLIEVLSQRFPDVRFEYQWQDIDDDRTSGDIIFVNGERDVRSFIKNRPDIEFEAMMESIECYKREQSSDTIPFIVFN